MKTRADDFGLSALPVLTRDTAPNPARMRRETLPLDGLWNLSVNGGAIEPVQVPFAPQAKVNGIRVPDGDAVLRYSTTFELPSDWTGALLHLEGVDHEAEILVNDVPLARHTGAWDPIGVFIPREVLARGLAAEATMLHKVEVTARDNSRARTILSGKQERQAAEGVIFYGNMSGIWKSVWIERVSECRIHDFLVVAEASGRLCVTVEVAGAREGHEVALHLAHEDGSAIALRGEVVGGRATLIGRVEDVQVWSTATPNLYFGSLSLLDGDGRSVDEIETYVGFRDFVMKEGYYRLNGQPFYLQGLLNQAIYPDTLYTPTDAHTLTDYEHTLRQGFNGERRHQTTPRHRDLWLADRMGYWLSIEMPSARNLLDRRVRAEAVEQWKRIVRAYAWNHPSVFFLAPGNEDWGLLEHPHHRVPATPKHREGFQFELAEATEKVAPPGMPYAANDGWRVVTARRRGQKVSRVDTERLMLNIHEYAGNDLIRRIYGRIPRFPAPGSWGKNPRHVFHSPDYSYDGRTPIVMSEIGGRALLNRTAKGVFAYGRIHRDPDSWAQELSDLITLMGELPVVRGGYVLTQTRDAGNDPDDESSRGEINGILDGRGNPKYAGEAVRLANQRARELWAQGF
ncbi:hypothetical protein Rumeso_00077 [Rubellimicrobium mesophilum DSM 19309]|uniref:Glycoside hydrolase family 2 immunoglobulin-like beta-sandwich domain-containing protein n=1 Tax=Rubellimicrobium mesophilum DSM 19309 TaxID=442562 RepID=A0A017HVQ6_9RHOB|nr:hypothetical protein [Rubellimicrobium mesophilum]EYD78248.1 hypothetical protein Rumeso_00077 [Rubellimicrobium mesophilum DSM 19309]